MNIFSSGSAGFVTSNLCRKLLEEGHRVTGIDDLSVGFMENIQDLIDNYPNQFTFHKCDIRSNSVFDFCSSYDVVYHLAARGETWWCEDNPTEAVDINVNGTINMLRFALNCNAKLFVFADTSAEYDNLPCAPDESNDYFYPSREHSAPWLKDGVYTPKGIYSITKMAASQFVRSYCDKYNINYVIFRPFNIYGPSMNLKRDIPPVIGAFAKALLMGEENPIIYGDGSKRRDFLYIDDAVDLLIKSMKVMHANEYNGTYNMGSGINYSMNDIYHIVHDIAISSHYVKHQIPVLYKDDKSYEAQITLADNSLAKHVFDWNPCIDIHTGIKKTMEFIKQQLGIDTNEVQNMQ